MLFCSFPKGSTGGRDGFVPQFYVDLLSCPVAANRDAFTTNFTKFQNLCLSGKIPRRLAPFVASAPIHPAIKPKGGIRPIAVGEAHRRVTSKLAVAAVRAEMAALLSPLQVGVGIPNGNEAIIHALNHLLSPGWPPDHFVLKVDFTNAFNVCSREVMFEQVRKHCPSLSAWVECCYQDAPLLFAGDDILKSCAGVQQGDPLGPLLFALVLHVLVLAVKEAVPSLDLHTWYLDDGTLVGSAADLCRALTIAETLGPE
jgi:hypothetical protein